MEYAELVLRRRGFGVVVFDSLGGVGQGAVLAEAFRRWPWRGRRPLSCRAPE